jgi:hypothetical protein
VASRFGTSIRHTFRTTGKRGSFLSKRPRRFFCGDLFTHSGDGPALTDDDIVEPALAADQMFHAAALAGATASTIRRLAALEPQMLALMHGSSTRTRCGDSLLRLADAYDSMSKQG